MYGDDNLISKEDIYKKIDSIIQTECHYILEGIEKLSFPIDREQERMLSRIQGAYMTLKRIRKLIYMSFNFERR